MPYAQPKGPVPTNYVERRAVSTPEYPIATEQEMKEAFKKAEANKEFNPAPLKLSKETKDLAPIDTKIAFSETEYSYKPQPKMPKSSAQTEEFLKKLNELNQSNSPVPQQSQEYADIRKQIEEFKASRDQGGGIHWAEMLGMAIPVVVGAGVGQLGAGAISSGQYGLSRAAEERKKDESFNKMLTELQGKLALAQGRQAAKNPSDPIKTFEGPDGKPYLLRVSQGQKLGLPEFKEGSFKTDTIYDPGSKTNMLALVDTKKGEVLPTEFQTKGKDAGSSDRENRLAAQFDIQQKRMATQNAINDKQYEKFRDSINTVDGLETSLQQDNWAANVASQAQFIRGVLREVGNLSEQEQARAGGSRSLFNRAELVLENLKSGAKLTDSDRVTLAQFANVARKAYVNKINDLIEARVKSEKQISGKDISGALKPYKFEQRDLRIPKTEAQLKAEGYIKARIKRADGSIYVDWVKPKDGSTFIYEGKK